MARLTDQDVRERLRGLSGWDLSGREIRKLYRFDSFQDAMAFANRVAQLAEEVNHHPDLLIQYDKVTLTLTSHDAGGLTSRDFRLAERIDA